jgi:hypothetical protein
MKIDLDRRFTLCLAVAFAMCAVLPAAQAEKNLNLDKHARKIEKKLSKFHPGSYVQIDFRNNSESLGSLGALSDATFQVTSADNNKMETYAYRDVAQVRKGKEYIGEGSEPGHRPRLLIPIIGGAAAAAAVVAVVEVVR